MEDLSILFEESEKKTFSQIVARFFEIIDYILLIPATLALFYSLLFPVMLVISLPPYVLGFILLTGYRRHWRGKLEENKVRWLWISTIVFNAVSLIVVRWLLLQSWFEYEFYPNWTDFEFWTRVKTITLIGWLLWFVTACSLSVLSIHRDRMEKRTIKSNDNAP